MSSYPLSCRLKAKAGKSVELCSSLASKEVSVLNPFFSNTSVLLL